MEVTENQGPEKGNNMRKGNLRESQHGETVTKSNLPGGLVLGPVVEMSLQIDL